ncbi:MAG: hypothetical protein RLZ98_2843 [Pseudomonadota bacterium]|jgi:DNA repair photolyase
MRNGFEQMAHRASIPEAVRRGRGARSNRSGRFEAEVREAFDDGWTTIEEHTPISTIVQADSARSIITTNDSPDISFDQSINPYRGCEHGCSYCYARPTHAYLGHSPGIDFETKLYFKPNAAELLRKELSHPRYRAKTIALGTNTDPYQPIERQYLLTRKILTIMLETSHPVGIVTKSALILRDLDLLQQLAASNLVKVALSITTLDNATSRKMEPRASAPHRRLVAVQALAAAGIPTQVMVAPVIPGLNDHEIEQILEASAAAGAQAAGYVMLRLPLELKDLFREWLATEFPDRAKRVIALLQSMHGGIDYRAQFGIRQRGSGPYADQIALRFRHALRRLGLNRNHVELDHTRFTPPSAAGQQLSLL